MRTMNEDRIRRQQQKEITEEKAWNIEHNGVHFVERGRKIIYYSGRFYVRGIKEIHDSPFIQIMSTDELIIALVKRIHEGYRGR